MPRGGGLDTRGECLDLAPFVVCVGGDEAPCEIPEREVEAVGPGEPRQQTPLVGGVVERPRGAPLIAG
ncbi:MAG TPA: hypothetical protein VLS88_01415 [Polyangiales bacterium]|nr:hypothetical protein [Polyangiales bacterium]